jgi:MOSC domain-containing protein YiiM
MTDGLGVSVDVGGGRVDESMEQNSVMRKGRGGWASIVIGPGCELSANSPRTLCKNPKTKKHKQVFMKFYHKQLSKINARPALYNTIVN